jgi:hypothetical protein
MLLLKSTNRLTFDVNIQGTVTAPVVRCVIGESPAVSFNAKSLSEGKFEALIDLPTSITAGSYPFKIEVLLNGRLFTPINTQISVAAQTEEVKPVDEPIIEKIEVKPVKPVSKVQVQAREKGKLSRLESVVKEPIQKLKPRKTAPAAPISESKIRIADIANEAADRDVKPATVQPTKVAEHAAPIPLTLVKGKIIYK